MEVQLEKIKVHLKDKITKRSELKPLIEAEAKIKTVRDDYSVSEIMLQASIKTFITKIETEDEMITDMDKIIEKFDEFEYVTNKDLETISEVLVKKMKDFQEKSKEMEANMESKKK